MEVVLGFDTSCYTTSVALISLDGQVLGSERMLLPVEIGKRGLRQSEAVFAHVRQIPQVLQSLFKQSPESNFNICAVAASKAPKGEPESYMPVFTVGHGHAAALASALGIPCYEVSHQQGHIAAGQIGTQMFTERFLALHLSGGTTELLRCDKDGGITTIGGTKDLHAGQLVDRVGVALGLPFPAGPMLEKLAMQSTEKPEGILSANMEDGDTLCHFSGAETKCQQLISLNVFSAPRIALEIYDLLARTVARLLVGGCNATGIKQALVVGGVASSLLLRDMLQVRLGKLKSTISAEFGLPQYSSDNAAGVAWLGAKYQRQLIENICNTKKRETAQKKCDLR